MTQPSSDKLVTDAMIEAGVKALEACRFHETGDEKKAAEIYRAMEAARPLADGQRPKQPDAARLCENLRFCASKTDGEPGVSRIASSNLTDAALYIEQALQHKEEAERERANTIEALQARLDRVTEALTDARVAIDSLDEDELGQHPELGHFYREELLAKIDEALNGERV